MPIELLFFSDVTSVLGGFPRLFFLDIFRLEIEMVSKGGLKGPRKFKKKSTQMFLLKQQDGLV